MAQLDALGFDSNEVLEPIIAANPDAKQDRFNELAKAALVKAIAQATQPGSSQDRGPDNAEPGQARGQDGAEAEGLIGYPKAIETSRGCTKATPQEGVPNAKPGNKSGNKSQIEKCESFKINNLRESFGGLSRQFDPV